MSNPITISKAPPPVDSMNYSLLVETAMDYIRQWAGDTWTDHNVHDPGITTLELLCYAITELGFKGQLDIKQLLDAAVPLEDMAIYLPEKALVSKAITTTDFQKLLIGSAIAQGVEVKYAQLQPLNNSTVGGLYSVLLEWGDSDLNSNIVTKTIATPGNTYDVEFAFSYRDEPPVLAWSSTSTTYTVTNVTGGDPILISFEEGEINDYFSNIKVQFDSTQTELTVVIRLGEQPTLDDRANLEAAIVQNLKLNNTSPDSSVEDYRLKIKQIFSNIDSVRSFLTNNRNLCEDFDQFSTFQTQEIALQASIALSADADVQQTIIDIFSSIDLFIDPIMKFLSLQDLQAMGLSPDEIYDGVLLNNGFLINTNNPDRNILYASDLMRLMLEDGTGQRNTSVIAIENFSMSSYIGNRLTADNVIECLQLLTDQQYQPKLSLLKTQFTFFRNGVEVKYDINKIIAAVESNRTALNTVVVPALIPAGNINSPNNWTPATIANYYSLQFNFPLIYALYSDIPQNATAERIAQQRQLSAYLLFFEQILANHLAQLSKTSAFFSILPEDNKTYFYQPLYNNPQIQNLLKSYDPSTVDWNDFINDPNNGYITRLEILSESPDEMLRRKNNILDHLLGRFEEELLTLGFLENNLNLLNANTSDEIVNRNLATSSYLLRCKSVFLADVCSSSAERAMGLRKSSVTTLSGLEKRLFLKLGILKNTREKLLIDINTFFVIASSGVGTETFSIKDTAGDTLLKSTLDFAISPQPEVFDGINTFISFAVNPFHYRIKAISNQQLQVILFNDSNDIIAESNDTFDSKEAAADFINTTADFIYTTYSYEGFYLVEHLLLRDGSPLIIPVENSKSIPPENIADPYSFQVTLVFPSGFKRDFQNNNALPLPGLPARFQQADFRQYVEDTVQKECPAHIICRIFWLDQDTNASPSPTALSFNSFENLYMDWLGHFVDDTLSVDPGKNCTGAINCNVE